MTTCEKVTDPVDKDIKLGAVNCALYVQKADRGISILKTGAKTMKTQRKLKRKRQRWRRYSRQDDGSRSERDVSTLHEQHTLFKMDPRGETVRTNGRKGAAGHGRSVHEDNFRNQMAELCADGTHTALGLKSPFSRSCNYPDEPPTARLLDQHSPVIPCSLGKHRVLQRCGSTYLVKAPEDEEESGPL
ncbi:hypothetical protein STEG23_016389 [Scotinomys teguina]